MLSFSILSISFFLDAKCIDLISCKVFGGLILIRVLIGALLLELNPFMSRLGLLIAGKSYFADSSVLSCYEFLRLFIL